MAETIYKFVCKNCNLPFVSKKKIRTYCSEKCSIEARLRPKKQKKEEVNNIEPLFLKNIEYKTTKDLK